MEKFIKGKLDVEIKVVRCKLSGKVILSTLEGEEEKRRVMEQKLKGGSVFLEHDLSWEEKKVQERLNRWAKIEREKGRDIKVGFAKVRVRGVWKKWEEVERELGESGGWERMKDVVKERGLRVMRQAEVKKQKTKCEPRSGNKKEIKGGKVLKRKV